jgi:two-component system sensor histidine kinase RegB
MADSPQRFMVNIQWLLKLRWVAAIGQLLTIALARFGLGIEFLLWPLFLIIGLTITSNLVLLRSLHAASTGGEGRQAGGNSRQPQWGILPGTHVLGLVMTMDMLSLTTLLYVTGGPTNPFCLFFFVNVSLSAVLLDRNWAWCLNLLSIVCFSGLLFMYIPVPGLDQGAALDPLGHRGEPSLLQLGLIAAFAACSSVIVYFMTRVTGELRQQELDLRLAQQKQSRSEKLEALGTLAAGAAHELATPLTTIALVAKDVEQSLRESVSSSDDRPGLVEDIGLIRQQLDRCKKILDRMASHSGETVGEMMQKVTIADLAREICESPEHSDERVHIQYGNAVATSLIRVPVAALSQAIRCLVQNALDASSPEIPVEIRFARTPRSLEIVVTDHGHGMPEDVLRRVSEPFFTTKQPGKGMGLGVFLAKNVIERLGGTVEIESRTSSHGSPSGTIVTIVLPQTAASGNPDSSTVTNHV